MAVMLALLTGLACKPVAQETGMDLSQVTFQKDDKVILEEVLEYFASEKAASTADLMVMVASYFKETPYVAFTLESEKEQLIINLREVDCTTFAENCLAISRTIRSENPSFEQFAAELQHIRYRDGIVDGYPSRLHYFCDWIHNKQQNKLIADVSGEITLTPLNKQINFMSTHPDAYVRLKDNDSLVAILAEQEQEISAREMYFIPTSRIAELEDQLRDGDIVGISTGIDGLAISHVGILVRKSGRIHLIHASSQAEKVIVSEGTLEDYLLNSKSATGIMLARPL
jgi:hypothetical protein